MAPHVFDACLWRKRHYTRAVPRTIVACVGHAEVMLLSFDTHTHTHTGTRWPPASAQNVGGASHARYDPKMEPSKSSLMACALAAARMRRVVAVAVVALSGATCTGSLDVAAADFTAACERLSAARSRRPCPVSYTHLRAHETR